MIFTVYFRLKHIYSQHPKLRVENIIGATFHSLHVQLMAARKVSSRTLAVKIRGQLVLQAIMYDT